MIRTLTRHWLAIAVLSATAPLSAQEKPTLTPDDYGQWERLGRATLSPDGQWLAFAISRVNEENELRIRELDDDSIRTVPFGTGPQFAATSRWLAWNVGVSADERERLEKAKEPVRQGVGLLDLETDEIQEFDEIQRFAFSADGAFVVLYGYAPKEPKGKGADLRILNLATGTMTPFGNVSDFAWSEAGAMLAMTLATGTDAGNGVQVYDAVSGRLQSLHNSGSRYTQLAWHEYGYDLAALKSEEDASEDGTGYRLLAWRGVDGTATPLQLVPDAPGMADTVEVVHHRRPVWSDDGRQLSFGLRPVESEKEDSDSTETGENDDDEGDVELPGLEIWHTKDVRLIPQQKVSQSRDDRRTLLAVWDIDANHVMQVGTDLLATTRLLEGWTTGIENVSEPYPWGAMFGRRYHDVWTVDIASGTRTKTLERVRYSWESASGRYLLWFDGTDYWTRDIQSGTEVNVTANLAGVFADTASDTPTDLLPPHGFGPGGWLDHDEAVFLYDEFDVWRVAPDGSGGERVTDGAADRIIHRIVRLNRDDPWLDSDEPIYFSLRGEWTERRGYARLRPGRDIERLVYEDKMVSRLARADSADVYMYQMEAFDDSPDLFVAGGDLSSPRQVTETNPFQDDYPWGRAELIGYESDAGVPLQGALLYPANHDPSRRYPMIVYTYEILTPNLHRYVVPSERSYYNYQAWSQAGYFVLLPDIVYRWGDPGMSALDAVRPAVAKTVEMGLVDEAAVGLIGHSWGGYQATFLPTRTNIFAASVAGAPLTDFVSFMGALHWNPGIAELDHWETGQARMEVPYWEDPEGHERNSPIHKVHEMETPLLMAFGNDDGVVDWDQGTEFFNFARRAGKQMVLLVYDGEDHGFRKKPNQIDYHRRILEWFGHYLKGEPAPKWITDGIPAADIEDEARRVAEKTEKDTT
jgi:dipeptidyl aminopeptidase/acylaminoacyl peptidase